MEKNYLNLKNSFRILIKEIKEKGTDDSLLIIAGDIFESKSFLNTDDIFQWKMMCQLLKNENIKTLAMCGNHDYNINSDLVRDNVSLLTTQENIVCINETTILGGEVFNDPNLEFYIFSPIDKKIPRILNNNNIKIAMLHEPINYAVYDNGELISNARFTASDLKEYDYVLLGDIHLSQFLTNRIAYCGSFVQKTKGESIEKGYILWDLTTGTGEFKQIPLKELYIKIIAEGDKCKMPIILKNQVVRHTTLIYKNCSDEYITALKITLTEKYKYINRIINNTKIKSVNPINNNEILQGSKGYNHDQIIQNILKDNPILPKILKHHAKILKNRTENNFTTYKLNYLYWSNVFCYGEDNYINFKEFSNDLVMLNGKNKEGKSSIIDIIIRVLFNECERGFKEDVVNKSKSKGFIKISFSINLDEFVIEQVFNRVSKNQQHRLYKNGVNITKDTIINTYTYLRKEVGLGDYKDFVNMTTALQNRKFLVDMPQKDFISLLTKITNIDILKDVEDENKKQITLLRSLCKKTQENINKIPVVEPIEISILLKEITILENSRDNLFTEINKLNKDLIYLNKDFNTIDIPVNLDNLLLICIKKLKKYNIKDFAITDIDDINKKIYFLQKKLEVVSESDLKNIMLIDFKPKLANLDRIHLIKQIRILSDKTYKPKDQTFKPLEFLLKITNSVISENMQPLELSSINEIVKLNLNHKNNEILTTRLPDYTQTAKDLINLEKKIQMFNNNFGAMSFLDNCDSCTINKKNIMLIFDLNSETTRITELKQILNLQKETELTYNNAVNYNKNFTENEIFERNLIKIKNNTKISDKISEFNSAITELKEYKNNENWNELKQMELNLDLFKKYDLQCLELKRKEYNTIKTYIDLLIEESKLLNLQKIKNTNGTTLFKINKINKNEVEKKSNLIETNKTLDLTLSQYHVKKNYFDSRTEFVSSYEKDITELDFLEQYNKVVNCKTGIPSHVLKNTCILVQDNCNQILQKIADFSICILYEKDIKIYTIENDIKIPATMGSGMQKFILDLIFRITLTKISSISSPKTLFVDEGFGSLDKENFISIANILQKLKSNFDSLIVISHISELRAYMDLSINITRVNYLSNVKYGDLTLDQKTLRLVTETIKDNKVVTEFKESVKTNKNEKTIIKDQSIIDYCNNNGGMEKVLLVPQGSKIFCLACKKEYFVKKNFAERHLSSSNEAKHNRYIATLI